MSWASATKAATALCLFKLWERGKLDLDDRVIRFIPEFGVEGKQEVRIRHPADALSAPGGYESPLNISPSFEENVRRIIVSPRVPYPNQKTLPPLGEGPGYNQAGIWIIAEVCRRVYQRDFQQIIREEIFEPLAMPNCWCGMPVERYRQYKAAGLPGIIRGQIIGEGSATKGERPIRERAPGTVSTGMTSEDDAAVCQPAGGGAGPARELAHIYEMMGNRGVYKGQRILSSQTVEAVSTPKTGLCYMGVWGLGFIVATPRGVPVPEAAPGDRMNRYGKYASTRTFGHPGSTGMQAFADPQRALATAFIGRPPIFETIYQDLGFI